MSDGLPGQHRLYNALLQGPLSAAGYGVYGMAGDNPKDVYITCIPRTVPLPGSGTRNNPWDGSTQVKFDTVMRSYFDAGASNITFHLDVGTFYSSGYWDYLIGGALSWGLLDGWHIKGAGKTATRVVQVVGVKGVSAGSNGALFNCGAGLAYDNQSVEDLWADCAWFRSGPGGDNSRPHGNFLAVALWGENATIRNVKFSGCGWADNECFALLTSGGIGDAHIPHNALIENCSGSDVAPLAGNVTNQAMINLAAMGNDVSPVFARNGRIIGNDFNTPTAGNASGPPGGYDSGEVSGNTFIGYYHGMFFDTFTSKNIAIVCNPNITAVYVDGNAILFNAGAGNTPCEKILIALNTAISASGIGFASAVKDSTIAVNHIGLYPGANADYAVYLSDATTTDNGVFNNTSDAGLPYSLQNGSTGWFRDNFTPDGSRAVTNSTGTPAFAQVDNGSVTQVIANTARGTFGLDSAVDPSGLVNGTTDRITAPAAGWLWVDFTAQFSSLTTGGYVNLVAQKNGTDWKTTSYATPIPDETYRLGFAAHCAAADYFQIKIDNETGNSITLAGSGQVCFARIQFFPD